MSIAPSQSVLNQHPIEIVDEDDAAGIIRFRVTGLETVVSLKVTFDLGRYYLEADRLFELIGDMPYAPRRRYYESLDQAYEVFFDDFLVLYNLRKADGEMPRESWLVENQKFGQGP